jgi:hypothetical protein
MEKRWTEGDRVRAGDHPTLKKELYLNGKKKRTIGLALRNLHPLPLYFIGALSFP